MEAELASLQEVGGGWDLPHGGTVSQQALFLTNSFFRYPLTLEC